MEEEKGLKTRQEVYNFFPSLNRLKRPTNSVYRKDGTVKSEQLDFMAVLSKPL